MTYLYWTTFNKNESNEPTSVQVKCGLCVFLSLRTGVVLEEDEAAESTLLISAVVTET